MHCFTVLMPESSHGMLRALSFSLSCRRLMNLSVVDELLSGSLRVVLVPVFSWNEIYFLVTSGDIIICFALSLEYAFKPLYFIGMTISCEPLLLIL